MGGLSLFNTLSGEKEPFSTPNNTVRMYVCGITPYAPSHIGHAMFSVVFDVVRRFLEFKGFEVNHVQNFTDIDDKMIAASAEMGITIEDGSFSPDNVLKRLIPPIRSPRQPCSQCRRLFR